MSTVVRRVMVRNIACFGELDLELGPITLLVGPNGSGKSTAMAGLFVMRWLLWEGRPLDEVLPPFRLHAALGTLAIELVESSGRRSLYTLEVDREQETWEIVRETVNVDEALVYAFDVPAGTLRVGAVAAPMLKPNRSPLAVLEGGGAPDVAPLRAWARSVQLLRLEPARMPASTEGPASDLDLSGANFASWVLGQKRRKALLAETVRALGGALPGLVELAFERAGRSHVLYAAFEGGTRVDFDRLSDGQRCLIVLYAVMRGVPAGSLVLLDEPDAHVTDREILPLIEDLREVAARRDLQVVLSSHHPRVIDLLASDTIFEFAVDRGVASARPLLVDRDDEAWMPLSRHLRLRPRAELQP